MTNIPYICRVWLQRRDERVIDSPQHRKGRLEDAGNGQKPCLRNNRSKWRDSSCTNWDWSELGLRGSYRKAGRQMLPVALGLSHTTTILGPLRILISSVFGKRSISSKDWAFFRTTMLKCQICISIDR